MCKLYFNKIKISSHKLNHLLPEIRNIEYDIRQCNVYPLPRTRTNSIETRSYHGDYTIVNELITIVYYNDRYKYKEMSVVIIILCVRANPTLFALPINCILLLLYSPFAQDLVPRNGFWPVRMWASTRGNARIKSRCQSLQKVVQLTRFRTKTAV